MRKFKLEARFEDAIDTICKKCGELNSECKCAESKLRILDKKDYKIEAKLRVVRGKKVTSLYPFYLKNAREILKTLKSKLACGGNIEEIEDFVQINLQGDKRNEAREVLQKLGFLIK